MRAQFKAVAVGAGYFSDFHYEAWTRIPEVALTAVHNRTESKAREKMAAYGIERYYADWREMIDRERPDFVDIVTPPETHAEICAYAAERGVHIVCQKPLAPTFAQSRRIVEATRGVRFMVHENFRWQPWHRRVKAIQREGTIGDFTHVYFRMRTGDGWGPDAYLSRQPFFRSYPRLLIYETGVHVHRHVPLSAGRGARGVRPFAAAEPGHSRRGRRAGFLQVRERGDGAARRPTATTTASRRTRATRSGGCASTLRAATWSWIRKRI